MIQTITERTETLKCATHTNAGHLNEALKIIAEQQAEIDRLTGVATELQRDMNGTLATLEAERLEITERQVRYLLSRGAKRKSTVNRIRRMVEPEA